jgi:hypothetical protein
MILGYGLSINLSISSGKISSRVLLETDPKVGIIEISGISRYLKAHVSISSVVVK